MGKPHSPRPVKLIMGMISAHGELFEQACQQLVGRWGPVDISSSVFAFDLTDYYNAEMGTGLLRKFVSFQSLVDPQCLAACKLFTNQLETSFAQRGQRRVNLDPGYLNECQLVLASTKNYAHRIYLGEGIYAELTLQYKRKGGWQDLPWTYPDYRLAITKDFLAQVRQQYKQQL